MKTNSEGQESLRPRLLSSTPTRKSALPGLLGLRPGLPGLLLEALQGAGLRRTRPRRSAISHSEATEGNLICSHERERMMSIAIVDCDVHHREGFVATVCWGHGKLPSMRSCTETMGRQWQPKVDTTPPGLRERCDASLGSHTHTSPKSWILAWKTAVHVPAARRPVRSRSVFSGNLQIQTQTLPNSASYHVPVTPVVILSSRADLQVFQCHAATHWSLRPVFGKLPSNASGNTRFVDTMRGVNE